MTPDTSNVPLPWSSASADEIAAAAGASDLFVFRRVAEGRFAHVGGVGRGAGWAGIVEIDLHDEDLVAAALTERDIVRCREPEPYRVLGPYYARTAAVVPVSDDVFVVFGSADDGVSATSESELLELASFASEALTEVAPAKRLADEVEALSAVRDLLQAPAGTYAEALQRLVDHATRALSCDFGMVFVPERRLVVTTDIHGAHVDARDLLAAAEAVARRKTFPVCVQEAIADELPLPFRSVDGVLAYYLLAIERPLPGFLLVLHTRAGAPRGFTLLCQALGAKLVEASEPLLATALLRDTMQDDLERAAEQARVEPLTGVGNRLAWDEALASAKPSLVAPVSIVKVDCRGLKRVNDTRGHHIGDQLLKQVAAILSASSRDEDVVARLGGDEFGVVLAGADEAVAHTVVERIAAALESARVDADLGIALAIGVGTTYDDDVEDAHLSADMDLLEAKRKPSSAGR